MWIPVFLKMNNSNHERFKIHMNKSSIEKYNDSKMLCDVLFVAMEE